MTLRPSVLSAALAVAALAPGGCQCSRDPYEATLSENVGASFATCNEAEIRFLAGKHNVQLAFAPCGNNNFSAFSWSPDGRRLYFQLVMTAYVMQADSPRKETVSVPVARAVSGAAWLTTTRLAIPVVAEEAGGPLRIAVYDLPITDEVGATSPGQLVHHPLPGVAEVFDLQAGDDPTELFLATRTTEGGPATIQRLDTSTGTLGAPEVSLPSPVDTFTYTPAQRVFAVGQGDTVSLIQRTDGATVETHEPARRGTLHPNGRWLALEHAGDARSPFFQRAWGEVSEQARKRELQRAERFQENLPDWAPKEITPPTLSVVDREAGERWVFDAFLGDRFSWYGPAEMWGSFFLWGLEGKQYKRNVGLVDLADRLGAVTEGRPFLGVRKFGEPLVANPQAR